ncbi:hypothetical protein FOMG_18286 [Fusarium oxysporum f. sp. melonis 26406]|uniref:Uncharacterized protein n=1 Tax=Fusarium oxysporum f. sp. melonis 26406 TaxID=1089452 RepID=W9Z9W2_FUSOX|nr:hypothetical protein FOMG_18286 [Fusarium oxysporum f. sp. melonis 26406]
MPSPSFPHASPVLDETTILLSDKTASPFALPHNQIRCIDRGAQPESNSVNMNLALLHDRDDEDYPRPLKRQKTSYASAENGLLYSRYTIAWICALHFEMDAALAMIDEIYGQLLRCFNDNNAYMLGRIENHNIVIACLPHDQYGNNNAAHVLSNLTRTFPSIRRGLVVGIGPTSLFSVPVSVKEETPVSI